MFKIYYSLNTKKVDLSRTVTLAKGKLRIINVISEISWLFLHSFFFKTKLFVRAIPVFHTFVLESSWFCHIGVIFLPKKIGTRLFLIFQMRRASRNINCRLIGS